MYCEGDLDKIVKHYRKPVKPVAVTEVGDVKKHPNSTIMSYIIDDTEASASSIKAILTDVDEINSWLEIYVPEPIPESELPEFEKGFDYNTPLELLAASIRAQTGKFAYGWRDSLIVADDVECSYEYPSGHTEEYFALANEQTANIPIFEFGYGFAPHNMIFVRERFSNMMSALMQVSMDNPEFEEYKGYMDAFHDYIVGIAIAHEKSELWLIGQGMTEHSAEREFNAEDRAKDFLQKNGVDIKHYELFHRLRASEGNISAAIVNSGFEPLKAIP